MFHHFPSFSIVLPCSPLCPLGKCRQFVTIPCLLRDGFGQRPFSGNGALEPWMSGGLTTGIQEDLGEMDIKYTMYPYIIHNDPWIIRILSIYDRGGLLTLVHIHFAVYVCTWNIYVPGSGSPPHPWSLYPSNSSIVQSPLPLWGGVVWGR